jgi:uncharacterized protein (TIGR00661 family)
MTTRGSIGPKILIAPLNWGLGHATRCIPIIKYLLSQGAEIIIACGKAQKSLLQSEFPDLRFEYLPGYDLKYAGNGALTVMKIIFQIPKILIQIKKENRWLADFYDAEGLDAVISDNRYGLFLSKIPCFFMTHQLRISTPFGNKADDFIQRINYRYISLFTECWIPDFDQEQNLAGELSHPHSLPGIPRQYLGCLSRFSKKNLPVVTNTVVVILSGPEPQRTIIEKIMLRQLPNVACEATIIRGLPGESELLPAGPNYRAYNHLPAAALNKIICESEFVICRSGYSSIMDIVKLGKKSIVIPTPGQHEQEYLASYLLQKKVVLAKDQAAFGLSDAIEEAKRFAYVHYEDINDFGLEQTLATLIVSIKKKL